MLYFHNDYNEMCHEKVLERIASCAGEKVIGYGRDHWCEKAAKMICNACGNDDLFVHSDSFLPFGSGGRFPCCDGTK